MSGRVFLGMVWPSYLLRYGESWLRHIDADITGSLKNVSCLR